MQIRPDIAADAPLLTEWRQDIHRHPELGYQESRTSRLVAERLTSFGLEVVTGLGGTGVVGTLHGDEGAGSIGLRANMDALPIQEMGESDHESEVDGVFHGCGHDGHTAMLLGAAKSTGAGLAGRCEPVPPRAGPGGRRRLRPEPVRRGPEVNRRSGLLSSSEARDCGSQGIGSRKMEQASYSGGETATA